MKTECIEKQLEFQEFENKKVIVKNNGDVISSDSGVILLRQIEKKYRIIERFEKCFVDKRNPKKILHTLKGLLTQRIFGLCQGYEDLNDHEEWRKDPLLMLACEKQGEEFAAGKSTLNRIELGKDGRGKTGKRYRKITWEDEKIEQFFIDLFLSAYRKPKGPIILDFDATDDPLHGNQEGRFFHGYYDCYCYLPLYVFCGDYLIAAALRTADRDASDGTVELLAKIVPAIREKYPEVPIIVRGDSGFCRESIMKFCEDHENVYYLFGLSRNSRLRKAIGKAMRQAYTLFSQSGRSSRVFTELVYKTKTSWSRSRRVIGKAEYLPKGENARFIVTNIPASWYTAQSLYEDVYCARGDMDNRIKERQLYLFADRTSTAWMSSNQLRLWFSSVAYMFFCILRTLDLNDTEAHRYQSITLRLKLLKVAAQVSTSTRRVLIRLPRAFPYWELWEHIHGRLAAG